MILVHGYYRFKARRVAFRNDFCLPCAKAVRSFQVRTFNVLHLFWIPLLPVGFWKRWLCAACGRAPHKRINTSRGFKYVGLVLLALFGVVFWAVPIQPGEETTWWAFRIGMPVAIALTVIHLAKTAGSKDPKLAEELKKIAPATDPNCPMDQTPLFQLPSWHCPRYGIRRVAGLGA